jgi:hypothetical protein
MGVSRPNREKAFLFAGILFAGPNFLDQAAERLKECYGEIILESEVFDWSHSVHYIDELGQRIKKKFFLFDHILSPETIADIKLATNEIEKELSINGKRTVNIDPGYLTLAKVVLATTKNYSHRLYLGKGIYVELTLYFRGGVFHPMPFAYEDYKKEEYIEFFTRARELIR